MLVPCKQVLKHSTIIVKDEVCNNFKIKMMYIVKIENSPKPCKIPKKEAEKDIIKTHSRISIRQDR
jgi:hypothetical protein